jgi:hypothetical protein
VDVFRAAYILAEGPYADWVHSFWEGTLPPGDPLQKLREPQDLRGEVQAWGGAHWTLLDALTTTAPAAFDEVVRRVCASFPPPTIRPENLALRVWGKGSLVIQCSSPAVDELRGALLQAVHPLITRVRMTDEEFQRAAWWIRQVCGAEPERLSANLAALDCARQIYRQAGSPPLPSSRYFRLSLLVRLVKNRDQADADGRASREAALLHFLTRGEPPWCYLLTGSLHTTIASGLSDHHPLDRLPAAEIEERVQKLLGSYQPGRVAIMGLDEDCPTSVLVRDGLTDTFVPETRPNFHVVGWADFRQPAAAVAPPPEEPGAYPYRVFISYAHEDQQQAQRVVNYLRGLGVVPLWDEDIGAGTAFTETIKEMIASAHLFMPLLSHNAQQCPWVHQEVGFAMGINIPVLPVALDNLPGEMLAPLQAVRLGPGPDDLRQRLTSQLLERTVRSAGRHFTVTQVADWQETRTELLGQYAERFLEQGRYGRVRQRAPLSSFSIPNCDISDPVWELFGGAGERAWYYRSLLRREREALERHARVAGCSLILSPSLDLPRVGTAAGGERHDRARRVRLEILKQFLETMPNDRVRVAFTESAAEGNLTLVGDCYLAEAVVPRPGLEYRQTVFNTHPPTVLRALWRFDREIEELEAARPEGSGSSRAVALARIEETLRRLAGGP